MLLQHGSFARRQSLIEAQPRLLKDYSDTEQQATETVTKTLLTMAQLNSDSGQIISQKESHTVHNLISVTHLSSAQSHRGGRIESL